MSAENAYIPIPEANTDRLRTRLKLPYQVEEVLGLNTKSTERHMQLGGIATLTVENSGRINTPIVVGMTQNGQALAGFTQEASLSHSTNLAEPDVLKSASWSDLTVAIDENASLDSLKRKGKDVQDPESWVPILENAIKDGVVTASVDNLIKRDKRAITYNLFGIGLTMHFVNVKDYFNIALSALLWHGYWRYRDIQEYGFEKPGEGKRWSLATMEFPELDRMAIQSLSLPFSKLVKKIK